MNLLIVLGALAFLMLVAYRGYSVILFAPVAALGAVLLTDPALVARAANEVALGGDDVARLEAVLSPGFRANLYHFAQKLMSDDAHVAFLASGKAAASRFPRDAFPFSPPSAGELFHRGFRARP